MNNNNEMISCAQAKQQDLVLYLAGLGYEPAKVKGGDYWYLSPLRIEKTASFKVNRRFNCWYDHGLGRGGNLVDFGILYYNCSVKEFLQRFTGNFSFHQPLIIADHKGSKEKANAIRVLHQQPLTSFVLERYCHQRGIPILIAQKFCREVSFELNEKTYRAIGFQNQSGGFELRTSWFKGSSAPKDITILENGAKQLSVFEGFFDLLSFVAIDQKLSLPESNFLVLNSIAFFEKSRPFMERHESIHLYLDRDETGQNCTRYALSLSDRYRDKSGLYKGYKDLNDWVVHIGKRPRHPIHFPFSSAVKAEWNH